MSGVLLDFAVSSSNLMNQPLRALYCVSGKLVHPPIVQRQSVGLVPEEVIIEGCSSELAIYQAMTVRQIASREINFRSY
jgi:hypothetical protein